MKRNRDKAARLAIKDEPPDTTEKRKRTSKSAGTKSETSVDFKKVKKEQGVVKPEVAKIEAKLEKAKQNPEASHEPKGKPGRPRSVSRPPAGASSSAQPAQEEHAPVEPVLAKLNNSQELRYWMDQTANEMRNQLRLRKAPASLNYDKKKGGTGPYIVKQKQLAEMLIEIIKQQNTE